MACVQAKKAILDTREFETIDEWFVAGFEIWLDTLITCEMDGGLKITTCPNPDLIDGALVMLESSPMSIRRIIFLPKFGSC